MSATTLSERLARVKAQWPESGWSWDDRFHCALSAVTKAQEETARTALLAGLPTVFTKDNLRDAPELVRQVCARTGGLLGGQAAYFGELDAATELVYCLWWPWGGGANFSARVGVVGGKDLVTSLRQSLGIK